MATKRKNKKTTSEPEYVLIDVHAEEIICFGSYDMLLDALEGMVEDELDDLNNRTSLRVARVLDIQVKRNLTITGINHE